MEKTLVKILDEIKSVNNRVGNLETIVDEKFTAVDKRFDEVDKKFNAIDQRFDEVDKKFNAIDQRFDEVDKKFDAIDKKFKGVDKKLDTIYDQVARNTEQGTKVIDLTARIENLETDVKLIKKLSLIG